MPSSNCQFLWSPPTHEATSHTVQGQPSAYEHLEFIASFVSGDTRPCSCVSYLALETFASIVLPVPRRSVPPPGRSPRRSPASRSAGPARRLWLRLAERRRWPSL